MRLIFKKSIEDRIIEEIRKAETCGKVIDKIMLTRKEYEEFRRTVFHPRVCEPAEPNTTLGTFCGYEIQWEVV